MGLVLRKLVLLTMLAAVVAAAAVPADGIGSVSRAQITRVAVLSSSGSQVQFLAVAATPGVVVAAGFGEADLFVRPLAGWVDASASATLVDSSATTYPVGLSISGDTAVVGERATQDALFEDVFVQPPGGWSGVVAPAARLVASNGARLTHAVILGSTVVAQDFDGHALYVFTEPARGWSGTVSEAATLTDSRGAGFVSDPAMAGRAVFAEADGRVDVFTEPATGWSGQLHESATLLDDHQTSNLVHADGSSVLAGSAVFSEPAGGWAGVIRPSRYLFAPLSTSVTSEALSDGVAVFSGASLGSEHQCPCVGQLALATHAADPTSHTLVAPVFTGESDTGVLPITVSQHQLISTGGNTVQIASLTGTFGHRVRSPKLSQLIVNGLASGQPRLQVTFTMPKDEPPLDGFRLTVPRGLTLIKNPTRAARHIAITGAPITDLKVTRSTITVSLGDVTRQRVSVSVDRPALIESPSLRVRAARLTRARPQHIQLTGRLRTRDLLDDATTSLLRFYGRR